MSLQMPLPHDSSWGNKDGAVSVFWWKQLVLVGRNPWAETPGKPTEVGSLVVG